MAAMKKINKAKAYAAFEKSEPKATKKMELKKGESKSEKARETKVGMAMLKKKAK